MKAAYNEATKGMLANDGGPFDAVIVKDEKIISTAHAEINAIREASKILNSFDLSECTLYTRYKPYPMCLGAKLFDIWNKKSDAQIY